jgi:hypothetical protein
MHNTPSSQTPASLLSSPDKLESQMQDVKQSSCLWLKQEYFLFLVDVNKRFI